MPVLFGKWYFLLGTRLSPHATFDLVNTSSKLLNVSSLLVDLVDDNSHLPNDIFHLVDASFLLVANSGFLAPFLF